MIIVYDPACGRITQTVNDPVPPGLPDVLAESGQFFIDVEGEFAIELYTDFFVENGQLKERPTFAIGSNDISLNPGETYTFSRLPKPCSVFLDGVEHVVADGKLAITADMPSEYELRFVKEPYREEIVRIKINEA